MSEADLTTVLAAVTEVPGKPAGWYAKRLGWSAQRVRHALLLLERAGHVAPRRVWVYEPKGAA